MVIAEKHFAFGTNINWGHIGAMTSGMGMSQSEFMAWALDEMAAKHVNTLHFNNLSQSVLGAFADLARARGIRLIPQFGGPPLYFTSGASVASAQSAYSSLVAPYQGDEAILAWSVVEEVRTNGGYLGRIRDLVRHIDSISDHPGFVLWGGPVSYGLTIQGINTVQPGRIRPGVVSIDVYPFFNRASSGPTTWAAQLQFYESNIRQVYQTARQYGSPLWVLGQALGDTEGWRFPTPDEMFWQAWVAIVNGAKGIMYWPFTSSSATLGFIQTNGQPRPHWVLDSVWDDISPFTNIIVDIDEEANIVTGGHTNLRARTFQRATGTERYIIAVNTRVDTAIMTNLTVSGGPNIYDLRTLQQITPAQLAGATLEPGRGNIYLVGSESDFDYYLANYTGDEPPPPECIVDSDCPPGEVCVDGICVPGNGGDRANQIQLSTLVAEPTFHCAGLYAGISGDDNRNARATPYFRKVGDTDWNLASNMFYDRRPTFGGHTNPFRDQFRSSVFWLEPDTAYEAKVVVSDLDGVFGLPELIIPFRTLNPVVPEGTGFQYYVRADGSDSAPGSQNQPWRTLAHALQTVQPGDTIFISGIIRESVLVGGVHGLANNYITVDSDPANPAVIQSNGYAIRFSSQCSYLRFRNLEFRDVANVAFRVGAGSHHFIIEHCKFYEIRHGNSWQGDIMFEGGSHHAWLRHNHHKATTPLTSDSCAYHINDVEGHFIVHNNLIECGGFMKDGIGNAVNSAARGGSYHDSDFYDNTVIDSTDDDIEVDGPGCNVRVWGNRSHTGHMSNISIAPCGIGPLYCIYNRLTGVQNAEAMPFKIGSGGSVDSEGYVLIAHNSGWGHQRGYSVYGNRRPHYNMDMLNNIMANMSKRIVSDHDSSIEIGGQRTVLYDYDCLWPGASLYWNDQFYSSLAAFQAATGQEQHAIQADPLFIDPANGDFGLEAGSPCRGAALIIPNISLGGDIGASDYGTTSTEPPPSAAFSAQPLTGTVPLEVFFTDTTIGNVSGWLWDFGDGYTSGEQHPSHVYESPGTYQVTLTAVGPGGQNSAYATIIVQQSTTTYSLIIASPTAGGSTTPPAGTYVYGEGTEVTIQAIPDSGWSFDHWLVDGVILWESQIVVVMDSNHTVVPVFTQIPSYMVTVGASGNGTTIPAPGQYTATEGEVFSITPYGQDGWKFDRWEGDIPPGMEKNKPLHLTITEDTLVTAIFVEPAGGLSLTMPTAIVGSLVATTIVAVVKSGRR